VGLWICRRLGNGWYVGKVVLKDKGSWNYYFEYQTSAVYDSWPGSAVENSYRFNVAYTMPGF
jgi:hypothetical protein